MQYQAREKEFDKLAELAAFKELFKKYTKSKKQSLSYAEVAGKKNGWKPIVIEEEDEEQKKGVSVLPPAKRKPAVKSSPTRLPETGVSVSSKASYEEQMAAADGKKKRDGGKKWGI